VRRQSQSCSRYATRVLVRQLPKLAGGTGRLQVILACQIARDDIYEDIREQAVRVRGRIQRGVGEDEAQKARLCYITYRAVGSWSWYVVARDLCSVPPCREGTNARKHRE
jgi:hypothetical protein